MVIFKTSGVIQTPQVSGNTSEAICKHIWPHLPLYIDEALEAKEMQLVRKHLASSSQCRREAFEMKHTCKIQGELKDIELQQNYINRFWLKVNAKGRPS